MNRKALLIAAPHAQNGTRYDAIAEDIVRLAAFLKSPLGGAWNDDEIQCLGNGEDDTGPAEISAYVAALADADYAFIAYSGHGTYDPGTRSAHLLVNPTTLLYDSAEFNGACKRQTVLLDCCATRATPEPRLDPLYFPLLESPLVRYQARKTFDEAIRRAGYGDIVLRACDVGQSAYAAASGSLYTTALMNAALHLANWHSRENIPPASATISVPVVHQLAKVGVTKTKGNAQTPTMDALPEDTAFPFAVWTAGAAVQAGP